MQINITGQTDKFNLSVVGEDFINDCCFGEDLSEWLVSELDKAGFNSDIICMEDFGWANQAELNDDNYLVCVSGYSEELEEKPNFGTWYVMVEKKRTFCQILTGKNKIRTDEPICTVIINLLSSSGFKNVQIKNA